MNIDEQFGHLASNEDIAATAEALRSNGFTVHIAESSEAAKKKVFELIPQKAEVMTMTSMTLEALGIAQEINESGHYDSVRTKLNHMSEDQDREKRKLAAAPDWVIGSLHAVTRDGHIFIASNTGSQMATEVYTAGTVVWVVGTQKIVANDEQAMKRIYEYSFPLEKVRAKKAYGIDSNISKVLIINKEVNPQRAIVILVKEKLGF